MVLRNSSGVCGGLDTMLIMVLGFFLKGGVLYGPCYSWSSEFLLEWVSVGLDTMLILVFRIFLEGGVFYRPSYFLVLRISPVMGGGLDISL